MTMNSLDIKNSLPIHRAKIINILDYNSEKINIKIIKLNIKLK